MRLQIEDYYGNDVIKLEFCLRDRDISERKDRLDEIQHIATKHRYSVADIDEDDDGEYVRIQQIEDKQSEATEIDLVMFVSNLTARFV